MNDIERLWIDDTQWWYEYNFGFGIVKEDPEIPDWKREEMEEDNEERFRTR